MDGQKKYAFINTIATSLFLLQLSFAYNTAFYFQHGKKPMETYMKTHKAQKDLWPSGLDMRRLVRNKLGMLVEPNA